MDFPNTPFRRFIVKSGKTEKFTAKAAKDRPFLARSRRDDGNICALQYGDGSIAWAARRVAEQQQRAAVRKGDGTRRVMQKKHAAMSQTVSDKTVKPVT